MQSTDSLNYLYVVDNPAICGTSGADEPKTDVHNKPAVNQYNWYKIELATSEQSQARKIFVSTSGRMPVLVIPNPVYSFDNNVQIRIANAFNTRLQGYIYDQYGHPKVFLDMVTVADLGSLQTSSYENGLYLIWLTDGHQAYTGKFVITR